MNRPAARPEIRVSSDIRELLGAEGLRAVTTLRTLAGGRCLKCNGLLPARGPAVAVLLRSPSTLHVVYAHPTCSRSVIVDLPDEVLASTQPDADMTVTAVLLTDDDDTVLPGLIAELTGMRMFMAIGTPSRVQTVINGVVSRQLELGFDLLTTLQQRPPEAPSWLGTVGATIVEGSTSLDIVDPSGSLFYTGRVYLPPGWDDAARATGRCVLFAGAIDLPPNDAGAGLTAAADAGGLTAGLIPLAWA